MNNKKIATTLKKLRNAWSFNKTLPPRKNSDGTSNSAYNLIARLRHAKKHGLPEWSEAFLDEEFSNSFFPPTRSADTDLKKLKQIWQELNNNHETYFEHHLTDKQVTLLQDLRKARKDGSKRWQNIFLEQDFSHHFFPEERGEKGTIKKDVHSRLLDIWNREGAMPKRTQSDGTHNSDYALITQLRHARKHQTSRWEEKLLEQAYSEVFFPDANRVDKNDMLRLQQIWEEHKCLPKVHLEDGRTNPQRTLIQILRRSRKEGDSRWNDEFLKQEFSQTFFPQSNSAKFCNIREVHSKLQEIWDANHAMPSHSNLDGSHNKDYAFITQLRHARKYDSPRWKDSLLKHEYSAIFFPAPAHYEKNDRLRLQKIWEKHKGMPPRYKKDGSICSEWRFIHTIRYAKKTKAPRWKAIFDYQDFSKEFFPERIKSNGSLQYSQKNNYPTAS